MFSSRRAHLRLAAASLAVIMALPSIPFSALAATPPAVPEPATPTTLPFPPGGGLAYTSLSLERNAHVRDARLTLHGDPVFTPTTYHLNSTTVTAGSANAWSGSISLDAPDQPPEAYIATPFNATQITNASVRDAALAKTPISSNFSYQLLITQVNPLNVVELDALWVGYALPPAMPIFWSGRLFLYNFTSLTWQNVSAYPYPMTGVQNVSFSATHASNFIKPGTGSVAIMIVSESTQTEIFTDLFEVTTIAGVWPKPAVDVGSDLIQDWRWDAPGYGAMGRQEEFTDGSYSRPISFPFGGASAGATFLVPADVTPTSATVTLRSEPDPHTGLTFGGPLVGSASGSANFTTGPQRANAIGEGSFVRLIGVTSLNNTTDENRVTRTGALLVGSDPNGYRAVAQTFNASATAPIATASLFVYRVQGNPGPINVSIQTLNATGIPVGVPLANAQLPPSSLANDTWFSFAFGGLLANQGTTLAIVVTAPLAPPDTTTDYITIGGSTNESFADGEMLSYFNVTGLGASWSRPNATDLLFDLQQDLPLSSPESALITLDGVYGTYSPSGSSSNLSFNIPSTPLSNGTHRFNVSNSNTHAMRFNWSAAIDYTLVASNLSVSILGSPWPGWNIANLTAGIELNLMDAVDWSRPNCTSGSVLAGPPPLACFAIDVNSSTDGAISFSDLDIRYDLNFTTGDLSTQFDQFLWATPTTDARANVSLRFYSPGPSTITVVEAAITYDRPPTYTAFPSLVSDEDVPIVTDLYSVFHDDYDNANLAFRFDVVSGAAVAFVALRGYNLTVTPTANLSGTVVVNVTATDSVGLVNWSGDVSFTFFSVNDPPRLTVGAINVTWGAVQTIDLSPFIIDAESSVDLLAIAAASGAPVTVQGRSLVFDFPANAPDVDLIVTVTDGVAEADYPLQVHPRLSNTVPNLLPIATIQVPSGAAYLLDLRPFASDEEDTIADLTFSLDIPLSATSSILWSVERNATTTFLKIIPRAPAGTQLSAHLTVTDRDGNTNETTLGIQIVAAANTAPRIVAVDPSIAVGTDPVPIYLVTKGTDPEDEAAGTLLNWTFENRNPELFTAEIDQATLTLVLHPVPGAVGVGSMQLRVRDSRGLEDTMDVAVSVNNPQSGSSISVVALGLFFAAVVIGTALAVRRGDKSPPKHAPKRGPPKAPKGEAIDVETVEGATGDEAVTLPEPPADAVEDMNSFMRGLTKSPTDKAPGGDEPVATLGLHEGLEGTAVAAASAAAAARPTLGPARLGELYLFSLKDGGLLYQSPPVGLALLPQMDENEFLQWAYDTVRRTEKHADAARILEWREWKVVLARGQAFFIAGRATGEDFDGLRREVKTLVEEIDHNFPGSALDWQRTETLESVTDILKRLVRGA